MNRETAKWVKKAEDDWMSANALLNQTKRLNDPICFHCQQMSEKYLKAIIQDLGLVVPRTHDLEDLVSLLLASDPTLQKLIRRLRILTPYAVEFRYPDESASRRQALAAVRHADTIRKELRIRLGLVD